MAAQLAGTRPHRVRSAVLHAAWPATDTRQDAEFRYWLDLLATGTFARMLPLMAFGPRYWEQATAESNEQLVKTLETMIEPGTDRQIATDRTVDLRPVLPKITAPVLVLGSAHDRLITAEQQRELVAAIPDARAATIDAGHGAPAELPAEFARLVLDFVAAHAYVAPKAAVGLRRERGQRRDLSTTAATPAIPALSGWYAAASKMFWSLPLIHAEPPRAHASWPRDGPNVSTNSAPPFAAASASAWLRSLSTRFSHA